MVSGWQIRTHRLLTAVREGCWRDAAALAFLLLATLVLFKDAVLHGSVFYESDTILYYYPVSTWVANALGRGHLPLWSPEIYGGFPLFADGETGMLYPLNLALIALLAPAKTFIWMPVLRCFLVGAFSYGFLRVLQPHRLPALVSALTVAFGSFMVTQMHHVNVADSAIWLPLILLSVEIALRSTGVRRTRYAIFGGIAFGMQLLTIHIQPVLMTLLAVAMYILFRTAFFGRLDLMRRVRAGMLIAITIGAIGLALAAAQLVPLAELAARAVRGDGSSYAFSTSFSPAVPSLITLIFPYFFRLSGYDYWTLWFRWETTIYAGIAPLLLALIAVLLLRSRHTFFFAFLAVVSLLLALGEYSPIKLYSLLWQIPGFSFTRAPGRFSFLFVFSIAVLAGLGVYRLQTILASQRASSARTGLPTLLVVTAAAGVALLGGLIAGHAWLVANKTAALALITLSYLTLRRQEGIQLSAEGIYGALLDTLRWQNERTALTLALLLGTLLVLTGWYRTRRAGWLWQGMLGLLVAFDLVAFANVYHPQTPVATLANADGTAKFLALRQGLHRVYSQPLVNATRPNRLLPFRIASVGGYSSLDERRYHDYLRLVRQGNATLLDLWNVRYVITPRHAPAPGHANEYRPVYEDHESVVYENASYMPRAFLVHDAVVADSAPVALQYMAQPQFDPRRLVVFERSGENGEPTIADGDSNPTVDAPQSLMREADADENQVQVISYQQSEVNIKASVAQDSYLVLGDSYYPGWQATVDGQPAKVYRGDFLFRVVRLQRGSHTIVFRYDPPSFRIGAAISVGTTLLLTMVLLVGYARGRKGQAA